MVTILKDSLWLRTRKQSKRLQRRLADDFLEIETWLRSMMTIEVLIVSQDILVVMFPNGPRNDNKRKKRLKLPVKNPFPQPSAESEQQN